MRKRAKILRAVGAKFIGKEPTGLVAAAAAADGRLW